MLHSIAYALSLVFILCGMFFICVLFFDLILTGKNKDDYFTVVPGLSGDDELSQKVYSAFYRSNFLTMRKHDLIIVIDYGLTDLEKQECTDMLENNAKIIFCRENELKKIFLETKQNL